MESSISYSCPKKGRAQQGPFQVPALVKVPVALVNVLINGQEGKSNLQH